MNEDLEENAALVNSSPDGDGWFFKVTVSNKDELEELMDAGDYKTFIAGLE